LLHFSQYFRRFHDLLASTHPLICDRCRFTQTVPPASHGNIGDLFHTFIYSVVSRLHLRRCPHDCGAPASPRQRHRSDPCFSFGAVPPITRNGEITSCQPST
jgi:hypothetical protein